MKTIERQNCLSDENDDDDCLCRVLAVVILHVVIVLPAHLHSTLTSHIESKNNFASKLLNFDQLFALAAAEFMLLFCACCSDGAKSTRVDENS